MLKLLSKLLNIISNLWVMKAQNQKIVFENWAKIRVRLFWPHSNDVSKGPNLGFLWSWGLGGSFFFFFITESLYFIDRIIVQIHHQALLLLLFFDYSFSLGALRSCLIIRSIAHHCWAEKRINSWFGGLFVFLICRRIKLPILDLFHKIILIITPSVDPKRYSIQMPILDHLFIFFICQFLIFFHKIILIITPNVDPKRYSRCQNLNFYSSSSSANSWSFS